MKTMTMLTLLLTFMSLNINADTDPRFHIQKVVTDSYVNGAFNDLNTNAMRKGFHKDFEIYSVSGEEIGRFSIDNWIATVEKRKTSPDFDPIKYQYDYTFLNIDADGNAGTVKIEFSQNNRVVFTDYLLLLKFRTGWKIVSKVFHSRN
ncbi:nuclear transport factor 2 family protein [Halobacteriovorax sp. HLS]|uniref:nuclear transport factor 2 family protein n=1 Tax=Halobacteriovorax sp. HLS TaxID=2234000 RepID=UPI000FDC5F34|nr:nuclear transport factor 2 family protein [Halobacteriovorax sp. HLS]